MKQYLTKSAFAKAITCPTKLYYYTSRYPTGEDENEYLKLLAEGGFIVGALAKLLYPSGITLQRSGNPEKDFLETKKLLDSGDIVLFEATVFQGGSYAIADILEKKGDALRLIEVKSKSFNSVEQGSTGAIFRNQNGSFKADKLKYVYDITYQYVLSCEALQEFKVEPYLLLVDKAKRTSIDGLPQHFSLSQSENDHPRVTISGDTKTIADGTKILSLVDMIGEVRELYSTVKQLILTFENALNNKTKIASKLGKHCRECEYRGDALVPSGFDECWSKIEKSDHHIFDLYYGSAIKSDKEFLFDKLIAEGKASLFDVPLSELKNKRGERQRVQIEFTKDSREWFDPALGDFLSTIKYPLHFIDFETTRTALPFHAGMRPFEQIAFQWSCHTVADRHSKPLHTEWINTECQFPNYKFAETLMNTLSKNGTVLTWSHHEGTVLSDILQQITFYEYRNDELREFFAALVSSKGSQGRLVDMNKLTIDHYFHPEMKGKTSIKKVFPAVWRSNPEIRSMPWFKQYELIIDGAVQDPYQSLPPMIIAGVEVSVNEGTAAMRAYEEMLFGDSSRDSNAKEKWKDLLLQYCRLDTLAMVVIWEHWERLRDGNT